MLSQPAPSLDQAAGATLAPHAVGTSRRLAEPSPACSSPPRGTGRGRGSAQTPPCLSVLRAATGTEGLDEGRGWPRCLQPPASADRG